MNDFTINPILMNKVSSFLFDIGICIAILVIGLFLIKKFEPGIKKIINKLIPDVTLERFILNFVIYGLKFMLLLLAVEKVGVEITSIVALLGAIGFAIGLAFQGALSNFAGGIIILTLRPFSVDHFVEIDGVKGTVHAISILTTTVYTTDNKVIHIPNGKITDGHIINYSELKTRRVDVSINASYKENSDKVIAILREVVESCELVIEDPKTDILLTSLKDSCCEYTIRAWTKTENYWTVYSYLLSKSKKAFDEKGIEIPFNKLDVNIIKE